LSETASHDVASIIRQALDGGDGEDNFNPRAAGARSAPALGMASKVGRRRLTASKPVMKLPMVSALETTGSVLSAGQ